MNFHPRTFSALILILLIVTACEQFAIAPPAEPSPTRAPDAPTNTPPRVAFPTVAGGAPGETVAPAATAQPQASPQPTNPPLAVRGSSAAPVAQIVSPVTSMQISVGQTFNLVVYGADDHGIARLDVTADNVLLKSEIAPTPAPRVFSAIIPWTPPQIGPYTLRVVAYDVDNRASAPDEVTITILQDARRPTAIIVYPIGVPQVDLGSVFQLVGVATDEVGVTQVELWVDNQLATYLAAPTPAGQPQFAFAFAWNAFAPGNHTLFVRAYDNQNQTTDSAPLKIFVADTHPPSLNVSFDRTHALVNEPITITVTALDVSGIQRIELLNGKEVFFTTTSGSAARQTLLTNQVVFQSASPGDFQIAARAINANGNAKDFPAQTISILRPNQAAPTAAPQPTPTRTRAARATPTPRAQPPAPPVAEIQFPADRFVATAPLRVTFAGRANSELERIELWAAYPGQPNPQIVCVIDAHASTQKAAQCEWNTPSAGVVSLYAQAIDIYKQVARSQPITGTLNVPALPTPTPTPISLAGRWTSATISQTVTLTVRQTGATVRGEYKVTGVDADGRIPAGTARGDRVTFRVEFSAPTDAATPAATLAPGALPPALDFDCGVDAGATTLTCAFRDARGRTGNLVFRRE